MTSVYNSYYVRIHVYLFLCSGFNYREFDLDGDVEETPHTWYLSVQSFITCLNLV